MQIVETKKKVDALFIRVSDLFDESWDRDLFDHIKRIDNSDVFFGAYASCESKYLIDLFKLHFAVNDNNQNEADKYLKKLLNIDFLYVDNMYRTDEFLNYALVKTQARIYQMKMLVKNKNFKQCHEILINQYKEYGELFNEFFLLLDEYNEDLVLNNLSSEEIFTERLITADLFNHFTKNNFLYKYRYALIYSDYFKNSVDLKIKWFSKYCDKMSPDLFPEWEEEYESGPLSLIQMLFIKELLRSPLTTSQKKDLEIIYSKAYNTCSLLAKYNSNYELALKNFDLSLSKQASDQYLNREQTLIYQKIAETQNNLKKAYEDNNAKNIYFYSNILLKNDKDLYFDKYNIYYTTLWDLANFEYKNKRFDKALEFYKEIKDNCSFKELNYYSSYEEIYPKKVDSIGNVFNEFYSYLNLTSFYCRFYIYLNDLKQYNLAEEELNDFLERYNHFSIEVYNKNFHLRAIFSQYFDKVKTVYTSDKFEDSVERFIKKTDNPQLQVFLYSELARYFQETNQTGKEEKILNKIVKDYKYIYHDNSGIDESKDQYTYYCLDAIKRLKAIYKNDPVKSKYYSQLYEDYKKSFEIIFNYFYPYKKN